MRPLDGTPFGGSTTDAFLIFRLRLSATGSKTGSAKAIAKRLRNLKTPVLAKAAILAIALAILSMRPGLLFVLADRRSAIRGSRRNCSRTLTDMLLRSPPQAKLRTHEQSYRPTDVATNAFR